MSPASGYASGTRGCKGSDCGSVACQLRGADTGGGGAMPTAFFGFSVPM